MKWKKITPVGMLKDCYGKRDNSETKNIVRYKVHVLTLNSQLHIQGNSCEAQLAL